LKYLEYHNKPYKASVRINNMNKKEKREKPNKEEKPKEEKSSEEDGLEQIVSQNKQIRFVLIAIGGLLVLILSIYLVISSLSKFDYEGVKFKIVKEDKLIFYNTAFPYKNSITGNVIGDYNFYIRNDPRKLEKEVPFNGEFNLKKKIVLDTTTENLFCDGDWNLAQGNFLKLEVFGATIMKDENATCDPDGRYTFIQINEGNETNIEEVGNSCYNINVNNCEILKATERFMVETFVKFNNQSENSLVISSSEVE